MPNVRKDYLSKLPNPKQKKKTAKTILFYRGLKSSYNKAKCSENGIFPRRLYFPPSSFFPYLAKHTHNTLYANIATTWFSGVNPIKLST